MGSDQQPKRLPLCDGSPQKTARHSPASASIADLACLPQRTIKRPSPQVRSIRLAQVSGATWPTHSHLRGANGVNQPYWLSKVRTSAALGGPDSRHVGASASVFACIVSRDILCTDVLDDEVEDGGECYGRRVYTVSALEKDTGLGRPAIITAKRKLVERGLVTIDPAINYRDDLGRIRTLGDMLCLNLDFPVPVDLLVLPVRSQRAPRRLPKSNGSNTISRGNKMARTRLENGPSLGNKVAPEAVTNWPAQLREPLKDSLKGTTTGTAGLAADAPPAVPVNSESSILKSKKVLADVDIEERRRAIGDALRASMASETLAAG